jgi:hypothetical protein
MVVPVYQDEFVTLYHGDSREIVPTLGEFEAVITDPVWPNAPASIPGFDEHEALMRELSTLMVGRAKRLVVHLGSTCDPRWLSNVDARWPFLATQQLDYAMPAFRGRVMLCDVAYAFGALPPGKFAIKPRFTCTQPIDVRWHPSPRSYEHVRGLVSQWVTTGPVLEPFAGSGTMLLACKTAGVSCVGVEINESFCAQIIKRLRQGRMNFEVSA